MQEVLMHQGGWDEFLYFGVLVVLAILALRWAEKRASRRQDDEEEEPRGGD